MISKSFVLLASLAPALTLAQISKPLKDYFSGEYVGLFTNQARLTSAGETYVSLAKTNFNAATESNACKWETIEPSKGQFKYDGCDYTHDWIVSRGGKFRGHTLVWHSQLPDWVNNLTGSAVDDAMKNHITTIMKHYKGTVYAWDVVNEVLDGDGTLRSSVFYDELGEGFIEKAFTYARAADPKAKLYYNDYGLEWSGDKQDGAYDLVAGLAEKGLIDGIGFQGHFDVGNVPGGLQDTLQRFASLGIDVALTEVDIGTSSQDFEQQALDYAAVTQACVNVYGCVGVTIGGIRDNESDSWRNGEYCLLWDENYDPKPALAAVAKAAAS